MPCLLEALHPYDLLCPSVGQSFGWLVGLTYVHTHGPIGALVMLHAFQRLLENLRGWMRQIPEEWSVWTRGTLQKGRRLKPDSSVRVNRSELKT